MVTYDPEADATYVRVSDATVASTDGLSDLVAVDVDASGAPVGLELLTAPGAVTQSDEAVVVDRYPAFRGAFDTLRRVVAQLA